MNQKKSIEYNTLTDQPLVWTALITPLFDSGEIDFVSLRNLVLQQNSADNGILLLGSTGEGLALTAQEHLAIVEYVSAMPLQVPLMVAVGGYNINQQRAWIEKCNQLAINAYLLTSPIYAKPGPKGQTAWFSALLDAAKFPCMLYNVPSRTGGEIAISTLQAVQNHKNCWALKEASGDLNKLLAYRQNCPNVDIYSGEDAMMPYLAAADVKGLVSVCANVWPEATNRYVALALAKKTAGLFPLWHQAISALFQVTSPIAVKVLLAELKTISSANLRLPLCHDEISAQHGLQTINQQIQHWLLSEAAKTSAQDHALGCGTESPHLLEKTNLRDSTS